MYTAPKKTRVGHNGTKKTPATQRQHPYGCLEATPSPKLGQAQNLMTSTAARVKRGVVRGLPRRRRAPVPT